MKESSVWLLWENDYDRWLVGVYATAEAAEAEKDVRDATALRKSNDDARAEYERRMAARGTWWFACDGAQGRVTFHFAGHYAEDETGRRFEATWIPDPEPPEPFVPLESVASALSVERCVVR